MEKRKAYFVSRNNVLTWVSVLLILGSAVVRLALHCEKGTVQGAQMVFQILLPILAGVWFGLIVLVDGKKRVYRTAMPVAVFALGEIVGASAFGLWHRLLVWLAALMVTLFYFEMISGRIRSWANRFFLELFLLGLLVLRAGADDYMIQGFRTAERWLGDVPLLAALTGLLLFTCALQVYQDGRYHKTWGDRPDGRRVRSLDPMTYVGVYIMPNRNGADNYFRDTMDVTDTDKYIRRRRREGMPHLTITQIYLAAYCRVVARYPAVNRFIGGQKIYSRDGDIVFNMIVKKEMSTTGAETAIKLHLRPEDTLDTVSEKLDHAIETAKHESGSDFDKTAGILKAIPGLLLKFAVWLLKTLDYLGLLPGWLMEISPFHGSIFFTSMASLGIPAIYHHLYDFGNLPVFCCLGGKYRRTVLHDDGTAEERKFMDVTIVCDERICDGFYYATVMKYFKRLMAHPELLETPPEVVNPDAD